jgi:PAS domain S-box-containing protein
MLLEIKERKLKEVKLLLHSKIIETMAEGVYLIRASDSVIVYANPKFEKMFGYDNEELIGKNVSVINSATNNDPKDVAADIIKILNETGEWSGEVNNVRKDGSTFWCHANVSTFEHPEHGKVWISVHTDITRTKKTGEVLKQSEQRFRTLMQSAYDAIIVVDGKGDMIIWNKGAKNMFGYSEEEALGKPLMMLMPEQFRSSHKNKLDIVTSTGKTNLMGKVLELQGLKKDGVEFPIELNIATWEAGKERFYSGIIRDISERKKTEKLRNENEQFVLANKTKNEFLTMMTHELRTPLNAVMGFSELLRQKIAGELNEKQETYVNNIITGGQHQLTLIDMILDMTKIEAGKLELIRTRISAPAIIEDVLTILKESASHKKVALKIEFDLDLDDILADGQRFKNIMFNLVDNAIKYSKPTGGTVTIIAKKLDNMARFSVSDTGIGIKEENRIKLFRSFQQVDSGISRRYGGIGLGLAITKQLVELHGGTITVDSKLGEGSTFIFTLPIEARKRDE